MSRILLVDDSPHAQRMGERILSEEGYEVVTVSNADSALIRLDDVDPDVVLADTVMPGRSGYEICHFVKMSPRHRHVRVVLTAGVLEPLDEEQVKRVEADATVKKPFEASVLLATVKPLAERATQDRAQIRPGPPGAKMAPAANPAAVPFVTVVDPEQVRAAVTVALDAAMEKMVDEISRRVLSALQVRKPAGQPAPVTPGAVEVAGAARTVAPAPPVPQPSAETKKPGDAGAPVHVEPVRRVSPLRARTGSILGLEMNYAEPEAPATAPRSPAREPLFPGARPAADSGSRATPNPRPAMDPRFGSVLGPPAPRPGADSDPAPRSAAPSPRPAVDPDFGSVLGPSAPRPAADPEPAPRSTAPNPRPVADPNFGTRLGPSAPRPGADPDPALRSTVPNPRPVDPDFGSHAGSNPRPAVDPDPGSRPASDPDSGSSQVLPGARAVSDPGSPAPLADPRSNPDPGPWPAGDDKK